MTCRVPGRRPGLESRDGRATRPTTRSADADAGWLCGAEELPRLRRIVGRERDREVAAGHASWHRCLDVDPRVAELLRRGGQAAGLVVERCCDQLGLARTEAPLADRAACPRLVVREQ